MAYRSFNPDSLSAGHVPACEPDATASYYDGAYRVVRDGVPCRVFHKRTREQAAKIAAIELACAAGVELDLEDQPAFSFVPAEREGVYRSKGAAPVPKAPPASEPFYRGRKRYIVGAVPTSLARDKLNHSMRHWAVGEPMGGFEAWAKRAAEWWEGVEASRGVQSEAEPVGSKLETEESAPPIPLAEPVEATDAASNTNPVPDVVRDWNPLQIAPDTWVLADGNTWLGVDGEFLFYDSYEEADRAALGEVLAALADPVGVPSNGETLPAAPRPARNLVSVRQRFHTRPVLPRGLPAFLAVSARDGPRGRVYA